MIALEGVSKSYGPGPPAVAELTLEIGDGELVVLVGPSGCGKTTILRMINRLIEPSSGSIFIGGENVLEQNAVQMRRGIGYVIQSGGLFPHRRVFDNVATVPRLLGWDRARVERRVTELLELVGLDPGQYARRYPHELSGGERQRVGVARALGVDPPVLLMDEPFAAVDPITRLRLQDQFLDLQRQLSKSIVFVTHDIDEAAKLGDRIAVLSKGGVLEQYDTPSEILGRPKTPFVADFVGLDRGVRRLAVVRVEADDVATPPVVSAETSMETARAAAAESGAKWAVVTGDDGRLVGWISLEPGHDGVAGDAAEQAGDMADQGGDMAEQAGDMAEQAGEVAEQAGDVAEKFATTAAIGTSLRDVWGDMLQHDVRWVPVLDEDDHYLGVLTPNRLHAAMRRSVGGTPVES
jgi:osmoprotectant transport system ATP-binding protein